MAGKLVVLPKARFLINCLVDVLACFCISALGYSFTLVKGTEAFQVMIKRKVLTH